MFKKVLAMSGFILLGCLAASAQTNRVNEAFKSEPTTVEKAQRDFQTGRDIQRENDRQRQDSTRSSGVDPLGGRSSVTDRGNDSKDTGRDRGKGKKP